MTEELNHHDQNNWKMEEQRSFGGWDFSQLQNRWTPEQTPWDYREIVLSNLKPAYKLLDLGTGGGEFLLSLHHPYANTSVTEAWPPNVALCREKLSPLGIDVQQVYDDNHLPFTDHTFDMLISRHEAYDASEVHRLLKNDGLFVTQQVGSENNLDLSCKLLGIHPSPFPNQRLSIHKTWLTAAGFDIIHSAECFLPVHFYDVGALVYYAKIIEWEFPNFSVDSYYPQLCALQDEIRQTGSIIGIAHRFIIVAKKSIPHTLR